MQGTSSNNRIARNTWGGSRYGRHERGTILLLVVGVLALLSIVAVTYVAIGQADRRNSATMARDARITDQRDAIVAYINSVLRDDLFVPAVEKRLISGNSPADLATPRRVRESWDIPGTAQTRPAIGVASSAGLPATLSTLRDTIDKRGHQVVVRKVPQTGNADWATPFNAAGEGYDPWLSTTLPYSIDGPASATDAYRDFHDLTITNISPDGGFANIGTLRPTEENPNGNFHASSGITPPNPGAADPAMRSAGTGWGLTLFDAAGRITETLVSNRQPLPAVFGAGNRADLNVPAHWTDYQRWLFRPANQLPRVPGAGIDLATKGPGSLYYLPYQYADTDGDGFFDSRWFELVTNGGVGNLPAGLPILQNQGPARLFIAARIIDASSMVNINTALQFSNPGQDSRPDEHYPAGLYPSDVDVERLLRLADATDAFNFAYDLIPNYPTGIIPQPVGNYNRYDPAQADAVGLAAFTALWESLEHGLPPLSDVVYTPVGYKMLKPAERGRQYRQFGANPAGGRYDPAAGGSVQYGFGADLGDALELFTFRGSNDPGTLSRLEQITAGRADGFQAYDPLRSPRPTEYERENRIENIAAESQNLDRGLPSDSAMRQVAADVRGLITPESGAAPIRSRLLGANESIDTPLGVQDLRVNLPEALRAVNAANVNLLFRAYSDALLRDSNDNFAWNRTDPEFVKRQSLFYGWRGPELALRCAGFQTVNLIDAFDLKDPGAPTAPDLYSAEQPTTADLLLYSGGATATGGPASRLTLDLDGIERGRLKLNPNPATQPPSIRVFGMEAQPFLTQVASYIVYCDTAPAAVANFELEENWSWTDNGAVPGQVDPADDIGRGEVTIGTKVSAGNPDFIFQMVAFQVHNPFGYAVDLSDYIVQFGDSMWSVPTAATGGTILSPGKTAILYATNPGDVGVLDSRVRRAMAGVSGTTPDFTAWRDRQLGTSAGGDKVIELTNRTTLTQTPVPATDVQDILSSDPVNGSARNKAVLLWRKLDGGGATTMQNLMLADRLRDPSPANVTRPALDQRFDQSQTFVTVTNAVAGVDPRLPGASSGDIDQNTGIAITMWGSIRRPRDPRAGATPTIPLGAIPAYCLEARDQTGGGTLWGSLNLATKSIDNPNTIDYQRHFGTGTDGDETIAKALANQTEIIKPSIRTRPENQTAVTTAPVSIGLNTDMPPSGNRSASGGEPLPAPGVPFDPQANPRRQWSEMYPQVFLRNGFTDTDTGVQYSTIRVGETLLPMIIGPWWEPDANATPTFPAFTDIAAINRQWHATSEALALGLDYDTPAASGAGTPSQPGVDANFLANYDRFGLYIADRGQLRLNAFVPFYNGDGQVQLGGSGMPDIDLARPDLDIPRVPGIPAALSVVEQFNGLDYGALGSRINGTINVNTAPLFVLRSLPLVAPLKDSWTTINTNLMQPMWEVPGYSPGVLNQPLYDPATEVYDVAATLMAYRDLSKVWTRPTTAANSELLIDFATNYTAAPGSVTIPPGGVRNVRQVQNDLPGLREDRGFVTPGEILCATMRYAPQGGAAGTPNTPREFRDVSIDRFSRDFLTFSAFDPPTNPGTPPTTNLLNGLDSTTYPVGASLPATRAPNAIADDYEEKLTIANAVLNTLTVRSDVFVCWFVIQGYLPSDVEGLSDNEPMVPSIQRRYVMVVDRSNVRSRADKPRILLLKEVPM
ncbi:MAG: hypothetical protein KF745_03790 [Phycisphaeraceae bacterium]|nr:hypothetical protein [Phycisphaeraceae bacterium]